MCNNGNRRGIVRPSVALGALVAVVLALAGSCVDRPARADDFASDAIAPFLAREELETEVRHALASLVATLSDDDALRLVGLYVAIDPSPTDPFALAACDDDGDYVIVVSKAMLRLVTTIARAVALDEEDQSAHSAPRSRSRLDAQADFLASAQIAERRLVPEFVAFETPAPRDARAIRTRAVRREAIAFVVARELTVLRAGNLRCAHPTATKEFGDDVWTVDEQLRARAAARSIYPARDPAARDDETAARMVDAGYGGDGALALLRFSARIEASANARPRAFLPTYVRDHPGAADAAVVALAAIERRAASARTRGTSQRDEKPRTLPAP